jgi:hypothetical protein
MNRLLLKIVKKTTKYSKGTNYYEEKNVCGY